MLTPKGPFATARPAMGRYHSERPKLDIAHASPTAPHHCIESRVVMSIGAPLLCGYFDVDGQRKKIRRLQATPNLAGTESY